MTVELYYLDGCTSYLKARENLQEALRREGRSEEVRTVRVDSPDDAVEKRLIGSPTVRLDGVDLEGSDAERRGYGLGCRAYRGGTGTAGWPSVEEIQRGIRASFTSGGGRVG